MDLPATASSPNRDVPRSIEPNFASIAEYVGRLGGNKVIERVLIANNGIGGEAKMCARARVCVCAALIEIVQG